MTALPPTSRALARPLGSVLALGLALALSGCTGGDEPESPPAGTAAAQDAGPESDAAPAAAVDAEHPVATQEVAWVDGSTATVDLYSLRVDGKTMVVTFGVTPHTETDVDLEDVFGIVPGFDAQVIDTENLKRYRIITVDSERWASDLFTDVPGNATTYLWAGFAAPEDEIDTADVVLLHGWAPFAGVTIER